MVDNYLKIVQPKKHTTGADVFPFDSNDGQSRYLALDAAVKARRDKRGEIVLFKPCRGMPALPAVGE